MTKPVSFRIRQAVENDVSLILQFIRELAEYEKELKRVSVTEDILRANLFGPEPYAHALIADKGEQAAAFAIYFFSYSTFSGLPNMYLEDIFVRPEFRGCGLGTKLFAFLARQAHERNCGRMEWSVLNWNESASRFYRRLGAESVSDWTVFHLAKEQLDKLINSV